MKLADSEKQTQTDHLNPSVFSHYFEAPASSASTDEIWCYSDQPCYSPGQVVIFHVSTSAPVFDLEIARDARQVILDRVTLAEKMDAGDVLGIGKTQKPSHQQIE